MRKCERSEHFLILGSDLPGIGKTEHGGSDGTHCQA